MSSCLCLIGPLHLMRASLRFCLCAFKQKTVDQISCGWRIRSLWCAPRLHAVNTHDHCRHIFCCCCCFLPWMSSVDRVEITHLRTTHTHSVYRGSRALQIERIECRTAVGSVVRPPLPLFLFIYYGGAQKIARRFYASPSSLSSNISNATLPKLDTMLGTLYSENRASAN